MARGTATLVAVSFLGSTMKVLIIGAAGMVGQKLLHRLAQNPQIGGREISEIHAFDVTDTLLPVSSLNISATAGNLSDSASIAEFLVARPDIIFHLAAVVSGEAEADFDKGYRINLDGTRLLLDAIRAAEDYTPRFVFTSSVAVFGAPFPAVIPSDFHHTPLTSYGTQKAICELLLSDYSRRGCLKGVGIRLPTICVRPGKPNLAASGFFSNIIREPLAGKEAILPVSEEVRHWFASPRAAVEFLVHAAELELSALGPRCNITMPGISVTVGEQIAALRDIAGAEVTKLIRREPDETIARIVDGWPQRFDASRAVELGFKAEVSFQEIIRIHIEDELNGKLPLA